MRNSWIWFQKWGPYYSALTYQRFDWGYYVYEYTRELLPDDFPTPLVKYVTQTNHVDSNILRDKLTGCYINKTTTEQYYKKQITV